MQQRQCKYGNNCRQYQMGQCTFLHSPPQQGSYNNNNNQGQPQRQCKYGNQCRKNQMGQCTFYHPPQQGGMNQQRSNFKKPVGFGGYPQNNNYQNNFNQNQGAQGQGNRQNIKNQDTTLCKNYHFGQCTHPNCNRFHGFIPQSDIIKRIEKLNILPTNLISKLFKFQINGKTYYSMRNGYDLNLFEYNIQNKKINPVFNWSLPDQTSKYNYFQQKNDYIFFSRENPDSTYDDICLCSISDWKLTAICNAHTSKVVGMVKYSDNIFISASLSGQLKVWMRQNNNLINNSQMANPLRLKIAPLNVSISFYFLDLVKVNTNTTLVIGTNDGRAILFIGDKFQTFYPINLGQLHSLVFKIKFFNKGEKPYALILTYNLDQSKSTLHCYSFTDNNSAIVVEANHHTDKFSAIRSFQVFQNYVFVITLGGTVNIFQWKQKQTFFSKVGCIMHQNLVNDIVFSQQQIKTTSVKMKYMMILQGKTQKRQGSFGVYLIK